MDFVIYEMEHSGATIECSSVRAYPVAASGRSAPANAGDLPDRNKKVPAASMRSHPFPVLTPAIEVRLISPSAGIPGEFAHPRFQATISQMQQACVCGAERFSAWRLKASVFRQRF